MFEAFRCRKKLGPPAAETDATVNCAKAARSTSSRSDGQQRAVDDASSSDSELPARPSARAPASGKVPPPCAAARTGVHLSSACVGIRTAISRHFPARAIDSAAFVAQGIQSRADHASSGHSASPAGLEALQSACHASFLASVPVAGLQPVHGGEGAPPAPHVDRQPPSPPAAAIAGSSKSDARQALEVAATATGGDAALGATSVARPGDRHCRPHGLLLKLQHATENGLFGPDDVVCATLTARGGGKRPQRASAPREDDKGGGRLRAQKRPRPGGAASAGGAKVSQNCGENDDAAACLISEAPSGLRGDELAGASAPAPADSGQIEACLVPRGVPEKLGCQPLRLVIVGHNPSVHAWNSGHYYSNPINRMWPILRKSRIVPPECGPVDDDRLPEDIGVGFTDVGTGVPGSVSSAFKPKQFVEWKRSFYMRLAAHLANMAGLVGCACGRCGAPCIVAFSGKRPYLEICNVGRVGRDKLKTVSIGPQAPSSLPQGWPLPPTTEVWVMTSTSGASALTNEAREAPWLELGRRLNEISWPRDLPPCPLR